MLGASLVVAPALLPAQTVRGRVLDQASRPLVGALVELRDTSGRSIKIVLTAASGGFLIDAPSPGRYRYRVAAIGYQPQPPRLIDVPANGLQLPDVLLATMAMRLPDLVALGHGRYCSKNSPTDETFDRVLESAHTALQIMEAALNERRVAFEVGIIHTRTLYGTFANFAVADTVVEPLARWPVLSIDPDTLRAFGFSRELSPGDEGTREYYGPDARVLFADWFLESHCFTVDKPKKNHSADTLHVRYAPAHGSKRVDVAGELVLDAHNLALLQFSFKLRNLPNWMPDEAAGGDMEFSPLKSGLWMTKSWAIWAPIAGVGGRSGRLTVSGQLETYGFVTKVFLGADTTVIEHR
jgi:carboxypeptidase family protein